MGPATDGLEHEMVAAGLDVARDRDVDQEARAIPPAGEDALELTLGDDRVGRAGRTDDDVGGQSYFERLSAEVDRRRGRDIVITFEKRHLRRNLDEYSWAAVTSFKGGKCKRRWDDFATDESEGARGALLHDLS